jgi:hypothetical protein
MDRKNRRKKHQEEREHTGGTTVNLERGFFACDPVSESLEFFPTLFQRSGRVLFDNFGFLRLRTKEVFQKHGESGGLLAGNITRWLLDHLRKRGEEKKEKERKNVSTRAEKQGWREKAKETFSKRENSVKRPLNRNETQE